MKASSARATLPRGRASCTLMHPSMTMRLLLVAAVAAAVVAIVACGPSEPPAPACVANLSLACQPIYDPPVYQTIFDKTFHPTCASGSGTCHTSDAKMGGLVFEDADAAYALLLGQTDGRKRVIPYDPSCSLIMERLESTDPTFHMPPGDTSLLPSELCAIAQWIANGAQR
jgi:hypothetical protein